MRTEPTMKVFSPRFVFRAHPTLSRRPVADLNTTEKRKLSVVCGLALLLALLSAGRAAHSAAPAVPADIQFVRSTFVNSPTLGKDPFYPKSTRRGAVTHTNITEVTPTFVSSLVLKGISGPKSHRLAIINNRTFEIGEEAEIRSLGQTFRVKCVEIRDDGVIVSVNGQSQKLSLGPKL